VSVAASASRLLLEVPMAVLPARFSEASAWQRLSIADRMTRAVASRNEKLKSADVIAVREGEGGSDSERKGE
jgi:hypothetical protein